MLNRLILKVTKFQLPPPKRLGTVVKNILGAIMPPMSNRVKTPPGGRLPHKTKERKPDPRGNWNVRIAGDRPEGDGQAWN